MVGRIIVQWACRWLLKAEARIRSSVVFVKDNVALATGFSTCILVIPYQVSFHQCSVFVFIYLPSMI